MFTFAASDIMNCQLCGYRTRHLVWQATVVEQRTHKIYAVCFSQQLLLRDLRDIKFTFIYMINSLIYVSTTNIYWSI